MDAQMNEAVGSKNTRKQPPSASKIEPGSAIMVAVHRTGHSISPSSRRANPIPMRLLTLTTKEGQLRISFGLWLTRSSARLVLDPYCAQVSAR